MLARCSVDDDLNLLIRQTEGALLSVLRASHAQGQSQIQEHNEKAVKITIEAEKVKRLHTTFNGWYRQAVHGKIASQEHYWKLQVAALKSKSSLGLQRALSGMASKSSEVLLKCVYEAWKEERTRSFQEKYRALLHDMKNKGQAQMKRIMTHMAGSNDITFAKTCLKGWQDYTREVVQKKQQQSWKASIEELRNHNRNALLQKTMNMFALEGETLVRNFFMAWKDQYVEGKLDRQKNYWVQDARNLKEKFAESIKQRVYLQYHTQTSLLMKHVYSIWKEHSFRARYYRMQQIIEANNLTLNQKEAQVAMERAKAQDSLKKTLTTLFGNESKVLMASCLSSWYKEANRKKMNRQAEACIRFQNGQKKWKASLKNLLAGQDDMMMKHIFQVWIRLTLASQKARTTQMLLEQKAKESKKFRATMCQFLEGQDRLAMQHAWNAWKELSMETAVRRREADAYQKSQLEYKLANSKKMGEVMTRMIGDREGLLVEHVFRSWNRYTITQQASKWQKKYNEDLNRMKAKNRDAIRRTLLQTFDSKLELLLQGCMRGWCDYTIECRNKREAGELQKKLKEQANVGMKKLMLSFCQTNDKVALQETFNAWKDRWLGKKFQKFDQLSHIMGDMKEKAVLNGRQAAQISEYWRNQYELKCFFSGWKDQCVSSCWRNSLAKWRDTFTALESKVREEAQSVTSSSNVGSKPLKTEEKMVQAEFEMKALIEALMKSNGATSRDFANKDDLKEWLDTQLGFSTQLCVDTIGKEVLPDKSSRGKKIRARREDDDSGMNSGTRENKENMSPEKVVRKSSYNDYGDSKRKKSSHNDYDLEMKENRRANKNNNVSPSRGRNNTLKNQMADSPMSSLANFSTRRKAVF